MVFDDFPDSRYPWCEGVWVVWGLCWGAPRYGYSDAGVHEASAWFDDWCYCFANSSKEQCQASSAVVISWLASCWFVVFCVRYQDPSFMIRPVVVAFTSCIFLGCMKPLPDCLLAPSC